MKLVLSALLVAGLAGGAASLSTPAAGRPTPVAAFKIDAAHSAVVFHTKHLGISEAHGRFNEISVEKSRVSYDGTDLSKSSILVVVAAGSVDTNSADRDKHLRSADFFNSKEFPEIVFESQEVGGTNDALTIAGELTFLGKTKKVTATGRVVGEGDTFMGDHRAGFVAELEVDMAAFGVAFAGQNPGAVGPMVHLTVSLECVRE
jgi:polyisoprenoid-binding protein YceI